MIVGPTLVFTMVRCIVCPEETRTDSIPVMSNVSTRVESFNFFMLLFVSFVVVQSYVYRLLTYMPNQQMVPEKR